MLTLTLGKIVQPAKSPSFIVYSRVLKGSVIKKEWVSSSSSEHRQEIAASSCDFCIIHVERKVLLYIVVLYKGFSMKVQN